MSFKSEELKIHRGDESLSLCFALWYLMLDNGRIADLSACDRKLLTNLILDGFQRRSLAIGVHHLSLLIRVLGGELVLRFWSNGSQFREVPFVRREHVTAQLSAAVCANRALPGSVIATLANPHLLLAQLFEAAELGGCALQVLIGFEGELVPNTRHKDAVKANFVDEMEWRSAHAA